ncbi:MAG TPA: multicopper oxidase family protein, partial [Gemmataceae bacterium]|nr:multicopper oxidase family protein [Gemmataceae bacterium]
MNTGGDTSRELTQNPPLVDPPFLCSSEGKLAVELEAAPGAFEIAGYHFDGMLYNSAYIPAVWRVRPGDTLTVVLRNRLPEMTNLHFHGMNVSPRGDSDNVFLHVHPGESFTYHVEIPPSHPPGLFWYHPHAHGRTSPQILGGMSGGIVVEGSDRYYPLLKDLKERVMLLKHVPDPTQSHQQIVTLNGLVAPTIPIRPGEVQYWRVGNVGADLFLKLKLDGMALYLIGTDGHYLPTPKKVDEILLPSASRIEAIVVGGPPGRYAFKSVSFRDEQGKPPQPERLLGVVVSGGPAATSPADAEAAV